jgi:NADPH:quinone reductase-like Zn-dependent oxidoreductase
MRAAWIERLGPPEEIEYGDLPAPEPEEGEVLVRVAAVAVNRVDTLIRAGIYRTPVRFPFVLGRDLVGMVVRTGEGFLAGERVWCNSLGHGGRQGSFAEYAAVPADRLYRLPIGVDPDAAVASLHPAATAWLGLFHHAGLGYGQTVLIGGGAGNVGSAAIQFAKAAGARVIATARPADADLCRSLGADEVLDYRSRLGLPNGEVDVHWDTYGSPDLEVAAQVLRPRGRILLSAAAVPAVVLPLRSIYLRDISITGFAISNASVEELARASVAVNARLAAGRMAVRIAEVLPLSAVARAHRLIEEDGIRGRLVLRP